MPRHATGQVGGASRFVMRPRARFGFVPREFPWLWHGSNQSPPKLCVFVTLGCVNETNTCKLQATSLAQLTRLDFGCHLRVGLMSDA